MYGENPKVNFYFEKAVRWQQEVKRLRVLALETGLAEELKWGHPCYVLGKANVFLIHDFKDYCALLFHKGSLLQDSAGLLVQQTENVQAARQLRFTNLQEIHAQEAMIKAYMHEAIAVEKAGLKVELKKTTEFNMPEEFQSALEANSELKTAFEALTPGRQRGYLLHFSSPKQSATRASRVAKSIPKILSGKGLDDESKS
ncbi:MAG: YdeI/OmpD-associated family protein [Bacteroidetes bacterium]|nr:YdeI/OmpD-associated family protein [Bacteroidota bacterium]